MVKVILILGHDEYFTRSKSGAIWGTVYFQIGDGEFFPEHGWTDLVAAFLRSWLDVLNKISKDFIARETVHFLDGPLEVGLARTSPGLVELSFIHKGALKASALENNRDLLNNAILVAKDLLQRCQEKGWSNADLDALAELTEQATLTLSEDKN
jgi:hypothetical protein